MHSSKRKLEFNVFFAFRDVQSSALGGHLSMLPGMGFYFYYAFSDERNCRIRCKDSTKELTDTRIWTIIMDDYYVLSFCDLAYYVTHGKCSKV